MVAIRPEKIALSDRMNNGQSNVVEGTLEASQFLGDRYEYTVTLGVESRVIVSRADRRLHRRAAHAGRRRRRRGRGGRGEHAEARAGPRRAPLRGRHHARRVPEAHREGRGAGAAVPADLRQGALGRGHHRDPARPQGEVRGPPRREDQGLGPGGGRRPLPPLHRRPLPARQGDRPDRRGRLAAADRDRLDAGRAGRDRAAHHAARDRARVAGQGVRRALAGAAGEARPRAGRPQGALGGPEGPLAGGEGGDRPGPEGQDRHRRRPHRDGGRRAAGRPQQGRRAALRDAPPARGPARAGERRPRRAEDRGPAAAQGRGRRGGRRRDRREVDRHPGHPAPRGRGPEARRDGGAPGPPGRRPGAGPAGRLERRAAGALGALRPQPAHRLVPLPRSHRRRQDRAGPGARRVPLRRRAGHGADRHVGVHGEAHRRRG